MSKLLIGGLQDINEEIYPNSVKMQCELRKQLTFLCRDSWVTSSLGRKPGQLWDTLQCTHEGSPVTREASLSVTNGNEGFAVLSSELKLNWVHTSTGWLWFISRDRAMQSKVNNKRQWIQKNQTRRFGRSFSSVNNITLSFTHTYKTHRRHNVKCRLICDVTVTSFFLDTGTIAWVFTQS